MFARSDFWIGLVVGTLAGAFGYKIMSEQSIKMQNGMPVQPASPVVSQGLSLEELIRQKEQLEDLIAEQSTAKA